LLAALPVQERVEMPEPPAIELDDKLHERLVELVVIVRATVSVNPFREETVMVDVPETPGLVEILLGLAFMVKSCAWYFTVALCERLPLVPVTMAR
jgi:hypothetical protein